MLVQWCRRTTSHFKYLKGLSQDVVGDSNLYHLHFCVAWKASASHSYVHKTLLQTCELPHLAFSRLSYVDWHPQSILPKLMNCNLVALTVYLSSWKTVNRCHTCLPLITRIGQAWYWKPSWRLFVVAWIQTKTTSDRFWALVVPPTIPLVVQRAVPWELEPLA